MRYLLYLTEGDNNDEVHYLIDRRNDYWFIPPGGLHFPVIRDVQGFHRNTLIDGELVLDRLPNGKIQPKYLVFDCMVLDGNSLMNRTLDKRLAYFKERIYDPYKKLLDDYPEEIRFYTFVVELKAMQFSYAIETMFGQILPRLLHGNDGLIFTCRTTDYKHGTDPNILKWKPENENSIDFKLSLDFPLVQPDQQDIAEGIRDQYIDYDAIPTCNLLAYHGNGQGDQWYGLMHLEPQEWETLKARNEPLNDRIVECYMDSRRRWRFMRFRDDKAEANHISTVESVIESIKDRVTKDDLLAASQGIRVAWKARAEREAMTYKATNGVVAGGAKRKADEQGPGRPSPGPPGRN
jgi:mRNA guanylyltransferase